MIDKRVEDMDDLELLVEGVSCQADINFWSIDLRSTDSDEVAEASRMIDRAKKRLDELQNEWTRRHGKEVRQ